MPLALAPDGKGWMKVSPPRRRKVTPADRSHALKSPLAYFACQPVPNARPKIPTMPVYHLDPNEHTPPGSAASANHKQNRSASNPHHRHPYDDEFDGYADEHTHTQAHMRKRAAPPSSTISHERVRPRPTPGAVAAAMAAVDRSARGGAAKPRAVTTTQTQGYSYWTGPSQKVQLAAPARTMVSRGTSGGGSSVSARWANATAALDL